jgi:hypothetical protein
MPGGGPVLEGTTYFAPISYGCRLVVFREVEGRLHAASPTETSAATSTTPIDSIDGGSSGAGRFPAMSSPSAKTATPWSSAYSLTEPAPNQPVRRRRLGPTLPQSPAP